jgi:outer membrane protein assembly factor BamB
MPPKSMCKTILLVLFSCAIGLMAGDLRGENWPRFRGPTGQGISTEKNLPLEWSVGSGSNSEDGQAKNIAWKTPIPGTGWSSPIVWGDNVFVTSTTDKGTTCRLICLDLKTGEIRWNSKIFKQTAKHKEGRNSHATPTPVTDGKRVYCVFSSGQMAAVDFDGKTQWTNHQVSFYSRHGLGASPVLYKNLFIMPFDGSNLVSAPGKWPKNSDKEKLGWRVPWDKAIILALDTATGKEVWTAKRGMSRIAHVTPNILNIDGQDQLVSVAGDVIQGFAPTTGKRIWTIRSEGEGVTPGFAAGDGLIFTVSGYMKNTVRTVRIGAKDDATKSHIAWETRKGVPKQSSLVYVKPHLYAVTESGIVTCYLGADGEIVWQGRINGRHSASPVYADGRIYFQSETGETVIIKAGPEFKILARNTINEKCQASIAISNGALLIRSDKHLFRIGK